MTELRIDSRRVGDRWTISVDGELDAATVGRLAEALSVVPADATVVFDLAGLMFMDSSGLRGLLQARRSGRTINLANPRPEVFRVLEIAEVLAFLPVVPDPT